MAPGAGRYVAGMRGAINLSLSIPIHNQGDGMGFTSILLSMLLAATAYGQSIVTPVFVHKDGEASASGYAGSEKDILVDGGARQVVGWVTFLTEALNLTPASFTMETRTYSGTTTI